MTSRGASALLAGAIAVGVAFAGTSGPQTFNRIYTRPPVYGTGSSGSAIAFRPDNDVGWYGDCSDGDVTFAANTTLGEDHFYRTATINAGVTVRTASYAFYACQELHFVASDSVLSNDGNDASGSTGGAAIPAGTLPGGRGGGGGGLGNPVLSPAVGMAGTNPGIQRDATSAAAGGAGASGFGGAGASGGIGQGGGGGGGGGNNAGASGASGAQVDGAVLAPANGDPREIVQGMTGRTLSIIPWGDNSGGGGGGFGGVTGGNLGGAGGGGGGAAGWMVVGARTITGPGGISAHGGQGGNGTCSHVNVIGFPIAAGDGAGGGGGGGAGGHVTLTTETTGLTADVSGGIGGSGFCFSCTQGGDGGRGGSGVFNYHPTRSP